MTHGSGRLAPLSSSQCSAQSLKTEKFQFPRKINWVKCKQSLDTSNYQHHSLVWGEFLRDFYFYLRIFSIAPSMQCTKYYTPFSVTMSTYPLASARGHLASNFINNFWCKLRLTRPWRGAATGYSFFIRRCTKQMTLETVIRVVLYYVHLELFDFNSIQYITSIFL